MKLEFVLQICNHQITHMQEHSVNQQVRSNASAAILGVHRQTEWLYRKVSVLFKSSTQFVKKRTCDRLLLLKLMICFKEGKKTKTWEEEMVSSDKMRSQEDVTETFIGA